MGVGDVGTDEFGNVTRLTAAQQQSYISQALALGASRADIDSFIANNGVNDLGRIVSALGLTGRPATGGTINTASPSAAVMAGASYDYSGINPAANVSAYSQYSIPTPVSANPGITPEPTDSRLVGQGEGSGSSSSGGAAGAGGVVNLSVGSSGFPMWLLIGLIGVAVLAFVMDGRRNGG